MLYLSSYDSPFPSKRFASSFEYEESKMLLSLEQRSVMLFLLFLDKWKDYENCSALESFDL